MDGKRKAQGDAVNKVKEKLRIIEDGLTPKMPFTIITPLGKIITVIEDTCIRGKAFLIKTSQNKVYIYISWNENSIKGIELHYADATTDLLTLITDEKLSEFCNAIQEEFRNTLVPIDDT